MAGPRLELFRFGFYVFFPILIMAHYGDPDWYNKYIYPLRDAYTQPEKANVRISENESELKAQLEELKQKRLAKRDARYSQSPVNANTTTTMHASHASDEQRDAPQRLV